MFGPSRHKVYVIDKERPPDGTGEFLAVIVVVVLLLAAARLIGIGF